jgi:hypothetical protein
MVTLVLGIGLLARVLSPGAGAALGGDAGADPRVIALIASRPTLPAITCDDVRAMMPAEARSSEPDSPPFRLMCLREAADWNRWLEWLRDQRADPPAQP